MTRYAATVLWVALAAQATWVLLNSLTLHRSPGLDALGVIILVSFTAFAALCARPGWRWLRVLVRVIMAVDFLLAVGDRFGLFGPAGAPGVTSGDFAHFVDYTRTITTFLPDSLAPILAVLATIAEITLATALLLGLRVQLAALGAAGLLAVYGTSMMVSLPAAEQFHYNVFVLAAGMLVLGTLDETPLTIAAVLARRGLPRVGQTQVGPDQPVIRTRHTEREARIEDQAI